MCESGVKMNFKKMATGVILYLSGLLCLIVCAFNKIIKIELGFTAKIVLSVFGCANIIFSLVIISILLYKCVLLIPYDKDDSFSISNKGFEYAIISISIFLLVLVILLIIIDQLLAAFISAMIFLCLSMTSIVVVSYKVSKIVGFKNITCKEKDDHASKRHKKTVNTVK